MTTSNLMKVMLALALTASFAAVAAEPEMSDSDRIARYRDMISDGNPADFDEMAGEELWKTAAGPSNATLEKCDLGKGPGVVKGVYAILPKYFKDTDKVQDLESRLVTCMVTLQGFSEEELVKKPFSTDQKKSDITLLTTYVVGQSKGVKMAVSIKHAKEKEAL